MTLEDFVRSVETAVVAQGRAFSKAASGTGYVMTCPSHPDSKPSLSADHGNGQPVVFHCHRGCSFEDIARAAKLDLGREKSDLAGESAGDVTYTYLDRTGKPLLRKIRKPGKRFVWEHADGGGGWSTGAGGTKASLYNAQHLERRASDLVWIVEGEKDAGRLTREGLLTVCNPGGAGEKDLGPYTELLRGRDVAILYDDDRQLERESGKNPGVLHGQKWFTALSGVAKSARLVHLPVPDSAAKYDVSDYLDAGGSVGNLLELYRTAAGTEREERMRRLIVRSADVDAWPELEREPDRGESTGLKALDEIYRVGRGALDIWTGIPSHGKSGVLDQIAVNLAKGKKWRFAVYSAENLPYPRYKVRLLEKWTGLYLRRTDMDLSARISRDECRALERRFDRHFDFIAAEDLQSVDSILEAASILDDENKIDGLIIDPWNELDHSRSGSLTETEYISAALGRLRAFARSRSVHVWVIAHPTKLTANGDGSYGVPSLYSISGSAHWANKADTGVVIWRDKAILADGFQSNVTKFVVRKMRFRQYGRDGEAEIAFMRTFEGYEDLPQPRDRSSLPGGMNA